MWISTLILPLCCFLWLVFNADGVDQEGDTKRFVDIACVENDLYKLYDAVTNVTTPTAESLHTLSELELILFSNEEKAVLYHKNAKESSPKTLPPLAILQQQGKSCGGLSDIFFVSAVLIKQLVDSNVSAEILTSGIQTLITLTADSGLYSASEKHIEHGLMLRPNDMGLVFRSCLSTPGVFESYAQVLSTRAILQGRIAALSETTNIPSNTIEILDEFVLSPTFYYIYQGFNDKYLLSSLHNSYGNAHSKLKDIEIQRQTSISNRKLRVGFVSAHFRRHSICKLFCRIIMDLHQFSGSKIDVFAFSALQEPKEDEWTRRMSKLLTSRFVRIGKTLVQNRREVVSRSIDILIYLDVGMDPATVVWAGSRLAPIQMCTWGHPSTTGLSSIDYYISSSHYHEHFNPALMTDFVEEFCSSSNETLTVEAECTNKETTALWWEQWIASNNSICNFRSLHSSLQESSFLLNNNRNLFINTNSGSGSDCEATVASCINNSTSVCGKIDSEIKHVSAQDSLSTPLFSGVYEQEMFLEQLIRFDSLNFGFERAKLDILWNGNHVLQSDSITQQQYHSFIEQFGHFFSSMDSKWTAEDVFFTSYRPSIYWEVLTSYASGKTQSNMKDKKNHSVMNAQLLQLLRRRLHKGWKLVLIPQHLPKFHPWFDSIFLSLLKMVPQMRLVLLCQDNKMLWRKVLMDRWKLWLLQHFDDSRQAQEILKRIVWLSGLSYSEYLVLLAMGDVMIDPFPFGGGVTSLEAFSLTTPVITYPHGQTVPVLTAGMLHTMMSSTITTNNTSMLSLDTTHLDQQAKKSLLSSLIAANSAQLIENVVFLLEDPEYPKRLVELRMDLALRSSSLFQEESTDSSAEWKDMLVNVGKSLSLYLPQE